MQENVIAAGAVRRTLLGSIQRSHIPGVEEAGCPSPRTPPPLSALGPLASPLTQNMGLGPSQHDGLDLPMNIHGVK